MATPKDPPTIRRPAALRASAYCLGCDFLIVSGHTFECTKDSPSKLLFREMTIAEIAQTDEVKALVEALRALEPEHAGGSLTFLSCTRCGATSHEWPLIHNAECPFAALAPFREAAPDA